MYSLLHIHSCFSTLDGFGDPIENALRAKQLGLKALSLSDHGSISGLIEHAKACKKAGIKCIRGCELYITFKSACMKTPENRDRTHMVVWAKNKQGFKDLIQLVSQTNSPDYFYYKPRISLWDFDDNGKKQPGLQTFLKGNIQGCSGHQGSLLSDNLFADLFGDHQKRSEDIRRAYGQYKGKKTDFYRQFLKPNWFESTCELALQLQDLFGKGNFWIELQDELDPNDKLALWIHPLIVECLRKVSQATKIPSFASSDPHYPKKEDAESQRCMVKISMQETDQTIQAKLDDPSSDVFVFFGSDNFYIHSYDEMAQKFTKEELEETNRIADKIEEYKTEEQPYIPQFDISEFPSDLPYLKDLKTNSDKYLLYLCVEGAKKLKPWIKSQIDKEIYWNRLQDELKVIFEFGLSNYFLVVNDICMAADFRPSNGSFNWRENLRQKLDVDPIARGIGRGSAANCLISYFTYITGIDPVKHNLLFSRFFNAGRLSKDNISLPDIDLDFAVEHRDYIINYIKHKYGSDNVGQIITFQTIKGRAAVKDMFRIRGGEYDDAHIICETIPQESVIADEIEHMIQDGHENYNILKWTLDHVEEFQEWYDKAEYKPILEQAMKIEGVKRGTGKHPSGIVISNEKLENLFPMSYDTKTKERIVGFDLKSAEAMGAAKFDILGVAVLSKLQMAEKLINNRKNATSTRN